MADATAVGAAVTMLSAALSTFKQVKELSAGSGDLALKESVSELYDKLLDVKQSLIELEDENRTLRQQLQAKAELERRPPHGYWFKKGEADPICPLCHQRDGKAIYLDPPYTSREDGSITRYCRGCSSTFYERQGRTDFDSNGMNAW
jgi:hypothetical protein